MQVSLSGNGHEKTALGKTGRGVGAGAGDGELGDRVGATIMRHENINSRKCKSKRPQTSRLWLYVMYLSYYMWVIFNPNNHSL